MAMVVARTLADWAARSAAQSAPSAATIGNFDGVHLGHQKILHDVVEKARSRNALAVAVTFDPHPLRILRPADAPPLIMTLEQRLAALEARGLDAVLVLPFTLELSRLSPEEFVKKILVDALRARTVLVGGNFRFGHQQAGDAGQLATLGARFGFAVDCLTPVVLRGTTVSSTAIRRAVAEGDVSLAGRLLGRPYLLEGAIRGGTGQGRKLVVPTLNLATEQELLPKTGVYVTETSVAGKNYRSATNVGYRPTFDGKRLAIESHLFDFSHGVKSGAMAIRFWARLRDEQKFSGPEALKAQVLQDISRAGEFFRRLRRYGREARGRVPSSAGSGAGPSDFK